MAVVTCYYNPSGNQQRLELYHSFADSIRDQGAELFTIECSFSGEFQIEDSYKVTTDSQLWQKERLINIIADEVNPEFDKIAWIDCDIIFTDDRWIQQAYQQLEVYPVIQLFNRMVWLNEDGSENPKENRKSFTDSHRLGIANPGLAWAVRREFFDRFGLFDCMVLGAGDAIAAFAFAGLDVFPFLNRLSDGLRDYAEAWVKAVAEWTGGSYGGLGGTVKHLYHGTRNARGYENRDYILKLFNYNPLTDINSDKTKPLQWSATANKELVNSLEKYYQLRERPDEEQTKFLKSIRRRWESLQTEKEIV